MRTGAQSEQHAVLCRIEIRHGIDERRSVGGEPDHVNPPGRLSILVLGDRFFPDHIFIMARASEEKLHGKLNLALGISR